jgi:hypothetical protein
MAMSSSNASMASAIARPTNRSIRVAAMVARYRPGARWRALPGPVMDERGILPRTVALEMDIVGYG